MEKERLKRYLAKLGLAEERLNDIEEWAKGLTPRQFVEDKKTRLATYKAFQEVVEACADICAMMLKDSKLLVNDDYTNIEKLAEKRVITRSIADSLKEANGLRNRLIHEYNGLSTSIAFESIISLIPKLREFCKGVKDWLSYQN